MGKVRERITPRAMKIVVTFIMDGGLGNALVNSLYENCINFVVYTT